MKKRELEKYFDKEWKEMKASLRAYFKNDQQEDLHHFRVQVKKLGAFLILAESTAHHPELRKYFKPVKKVFKQAGEIRNAFINQQLSKSYHLGNREFINTQKLLQIEADRKFRLKDAQHLKKIRDARKTIKAKLRSISNVHINIFYQNQLRQLELTLARLRFNEQLHTSRKQVKVLAYNYKLAHTALHTGFNEKYLDQIQTAIGNWHDHDLAVSIFLKNKRINKAHLEHLKIPGIKLKSRVSSLTKNFYDRATTAVDLPVEQLS